jgi:3-hydroxy-9,10-secoandrosta-1,3,5(10)-triene-9,17-dione monooxygenase
MTGAEFRDAVEAILPGIAARAEQAENERSVPKETIAQLQENGLLQGMQPKLFGGAELDPAVFFDAGMRVAEACPATGWIFTVLGVHGWHLGLFSEQAQRDVWASDPRTLVSSAYMPTGKVELVEGGYRLCGRFPFSSGSDHCDWALLGGLLPTTEAHAEKARAAGLRRAPEANKCSLLVPRADWVLEDNWDTFGMRGSGSKTIFVEDAFVPEHRVLSDLDAMIGDVPGAAVNTSPLYQMPWGLMLAYAVACPAVGAAVGAVEILRQRQAARFADMATAPPENAFLQYNLAEACSLASDARLRMVTNMRDAYAAVCADGKWPLLDRARARWESARAVRTACAAMDLVMESSGGRAIYVGDPVQRYLRDLHAIRQHPANSPEASSRTFARVATGLPIQELQL